MNERNGFAATPNFNELSPSKKQSCNYQIKPFMNDNVRGGMQSQRIQYVKHRKSLQRKKFKLKCKALEKSISKHIVKVYQ